METLSGSTPGYWLVQVSVRLHRLLQEFRSSAILLHCCCVVFCARVFPLGTTGSWERMRSPQQRVRCTSRQQQHQLPTPTPTGARHTSARSTVTSQCSSVRRLDGSYQSQCVVCSSCAHRTAPHRTFSQQHQHQQSAKDDSEEREKQCIRTAYS